MTESEFIDRLDQHVEQGNQIMAESNRIHAKSVSIHAEANRIHEESNRIHKESNRIHEEATRVIAENRDFMREMTVRQERVTQQLVDQISAGTQELKDVGLATRQHTQALARMLDRLD